MTNSTPQVTEFVSAFKALALSRDTDAIELDDFHDRLKVIIDDVEEIGVRRKFFEEITRFDPDDKFAMRFGTHKYGRRGPRR